MKGRRIELQPYTVTTRKVADDGNITEVAGSEYNVRESLYAVLTSPHLRLNGAQLLKNAALGASLRDHAEASKLVDSNEYTQLVAAVNAISGLGHAEIEFVKRVLEAEEVDTDQSC